MEDFLVTQCNENVSFKEQIGSDSIINELFMSRC